MILTRPEAQSDSFAGEVRACWSGPLEVVISPLLRIVPMAPRIGSVDAVIFTSANGVEAAERLNIPKGVPAWCVGEKTGALAQGAGFVPHIGPGDADGLIASIIAAQPNGRLVHLRGKHARGAVKDRLRAAGLDCADFIAYDQQPQMLNNDAKRALDAQEPVIFPLFSPRTATILHQQGPFSAPVHVIALSQAVADGFGGGSARQVTVATRPDMPAMLTATLDALRAHSGHRA
ncbi:hypothetical protein AN191_01865 [Loktanella sp. 5RATIMAR09]|nr:hypothetical protein AN191_01865 [Loktanella sp. 5RATIMAR09]